MMHFKAILGFKMLLISLWCSLMPILLLSVALCTAKCIKIPRTVDTVNSPGAKLTSSWVSRELAISWVDFTNACIAIHPFHSTAKREFLNLSSPKLVALINATVLGLHWDFLLLKDCTMSIWKGGGQERQKGGEIEKGGGGTARKDDSTFSLLPWPTAIYDNGNIWWLPTSCLEIRLIILLAVMFC